MGPTSADVSRLRVELNLTHHAMAKFLNVKEATIKSWESGAAKINGPAAVIVASFLAFSKTHPDVLPDLRDRVECSLLRAGFGDLLTDLLGLYAGMAGRVT